MIRVLKITYVAIKYKISYKSAKALYSFHKYTKRHLEK